MVPVKCVSVKSVCQVGGGVTELGPRAPERGAESTCGKDHDDESHSERHLS